MDKNKEHVKYFEDQFDDEEVLYVFRKHPVVMRRGLILFCLGPLIGIMPSFLDPSLGFGAFFGGIGAGILLGALLFTPGWVSWYFSVFIATDQRFMQITQKGFFHRAVNDLALSQIQSVNWEVSGIQQTILGFGTIIMQTYVGDLIIHDIHHPSKVQKKLAGILRQEGINLSPPPIRDNIQEEYEEDSGDEGYDGEIEEA